MKPWYIVWTCCFYISYGNGSLFGEGGNFSPKEVDQLQRLLEKTSRKIDTLEDSIQADTERLETASLEQVLSGRGSVVSPPPRRECQGPPQKDEE